MKLLLTGPRGFVGARIIQACPGVAAAPSLKNVSEDDVRRLVDETQPDVIIHTAAISDIGECARNPEAAYRANVELPLWLVKTGVKCLLFSTDQVYSACADDGPYAEDNTAPANLYAEQKLEMEQRSLDINPDTVLLRATWMYDMPIYGAANRGNFLMNMLLSPSLSFPENQYRGLTWVREVAERTLEAVTLPGGIYNFGSEASLPVLEIARQFAELLHLPVTLTAGESRHNLWMDCSKIRAVGGQRLLPGSTVRTFAADGSSCPTPGICGYVQAQPRMPGSCTKKQGILFQDTLQGLIKCAESYGLLR